MGNTNCEYCVREYCVRMITKRDFMGLIGSFILFCIVIMGSTFTVSATPTQWHGRATAEMQGVTSEQIWPLLSDYCNIYQWMPNVQATYCSEGPFSSCLEFQPGLVRNSSSSNLLSLTPPPSPPADERKTWATEELTAIDCNEKQFTFVVLDSNIGIKNYTATLKLINNYSCQDRHGGGDEGASGCILEYTFKIDPFEGSTSESFFSFVNSFVPAMAEQMRAAALSGDHINLQSM